MSTEDQEENRNRTINRRYLSIPSWELRLRFSEHVYSGTKFIYEFISGRPVFSSVSFSLSLFFFFFIPRTLECRDTIPSHESEIWTAIRRFQFPWFNTAPARSARCFDWCAEILVLFSPPKILLQLVVFLFSNLKTKKTQNASNKTLLVKLDFCLLRNSCGWCDPRKTWASPQQNCLKSTIKNYLLPEMCEK